MVEKHTEMCIKMGLNILHYRKLKNLTQAQLAELCHISEQQIQRIETAQSYPKIPTLFDIANALQVPASKFFDFRD